MRDSLLEDNSRGWWGDTAIHFYIGYHATANTTALLPKTLALVAISKCVHFVYALFGFHFASWLSFANVSSEVPVNSSLDALYQPYHFPQATRFHAFCFAELIFMCMRKNR